MRLNRFLALSGVASRRGAETLIAEGRVRVNGAVVTDLATFVEPGVDRVEADGRRVFTPRTFTYLLLHKPEGVVTTARDPQGRPTVMDMVPPRPRVFPVGRLDQETSGALIFTDDGSLAHGLLHPRFKMEKEYEVLVEGAIDDEALEGLRQGVLLEDETRPTAPATVEVLERRHGRTRLQVIIREGRKRQVRRMLALVGHPVIKLRRLRFGPIGLGDLEPGLCRPLTEAEVKALRRFVEEQRVAARGAPRRGRRAGAAAARGKPAGPRAPRTVEPAEPKPKSPRAPRPAEPKPKGARTSRAARPAEPKSPRAPRPAKPAAPKPKSPRAPRPSRPAAPKPKGPRTPRTARPAKPRAGRGGSNHSR